MNSLQLISYNTLQVKDTQFLPQLKAIEAYLLINNATADMVAWDTKVPVEQVKLILERLQAEGRLAVTHIGLCTYSGLKGRYVTTDPTLFSHDSNEFYIFGGLEGGLKNAA